jgi:Family of unknown function (DUF5701)
VTDASAEFHRQVQTLVDNDYPIASGQTRAEFLALVEPLEELLGSLADPSHDQALPFAIVVTADVVPTAHVMEHVVDGKGKCGLVNMDPVEPDAFSTIATVEVPDAPAYLIADIDTGAETLSVRPRDALPIIEGHGRTPLTIDEGVAVLAQFPEVLRTHNAYQLLASRRDDKRIPSIWTSYRQPRLGWCWEGNPHTWLGMASAADRDREGLSHSTPSGPRPVRR